MVLLCSLGHADDGNVDASSAACRTCIWNKRVKPQLYDQGVTTFWLDDDERNKFTFNAAKCLPTAPIGSPCSSSACCASGFCDPSLEKCAKRKPSPASAAAVVPVELGDPTQVGANCSGEVGIDVGGAPGQHRIAQLLGTTQQTCCTNCTATPTCRTWIFAPKNDIGEGVHARSSHSAGTCWLLTGAAEGTPHKNRVSGGDVTPHGPQCPGPHCPPDVSGGQPITNYITALLFFLNGAQTHG